MNQNAERAREGWGALFYDQLKNRAVRSGLPDLPDFAHQRRAGLERHLPRLPAGKRYFAGRADVLEGFDLLDTFSTRKPAHRAR